jgi:hypothetical protein
MRLAVAARRCLAGCLALLALAAPATFAADISPATVYAEALRIGQEVDLIKRHFKITGHATAAPVTADLQPRHVWQKTYLILIKLNLFRRKHGLTGFAPLIHEPDLKSDPRTAWGQTQRILTEIRIIKAYLDIPGAVGPIATVAGKRPIDVFNKLDEISHDLDLLVGEQVNPSVVYAEALRVDQDVDLLLRHVGTADIAFPPARNPAAKPKDSLRAAFAVMDQIQRLQRKLGLPGTDFTAFRDRDDAVSADVLNMVGMCVAEIQLVKAQLGLLHSLTPPAEYQAGKTPTEVAQLLSYMAAKLRLVEL